MGDDDIASGRRPWDPQFPDPMPGLREAMSKHPIVFIVGPNGAGKTKMMAGIALSTSGGIWSLADQAEDRIMKERFQGGFSDYEETLKTVGALFLDDLFRWLLLELKMVGKKAVPISGKISEKSARRVELWTKILDYRRVNNRLTLATTNCFPSWTGHRAFASRFEPCCLVQKQPDYRPILHGGAQP